MKRIWILSLPLALVLTAAGCAQSSQSYSDWSAAARLASVSTEYMDSCPAFTRDGLSLYLVSGASPRDLYVSQRASGAEAWGTPKRLGNNINTTTAEERCPYVTPDGLRLIFVRSTTGVGDDFYMSVRRDKKDDFGWGDPVIIDALNSPGMETAGWGFEDRGDKLTFYFGSNRNNSQFDIFQTSMDSNGKFTTPVPVSELNDPTAIDYFPVVRKDGLEIYFISSRTGGLGGQDGWVSTRKTTSEKWSTPVNLGAAINSTANEWRAGLTWDGMGMIFSSNRTGNYDLYGSQRIIVTGAKK
jgi:hypothetical protein